MIAHVTVRLRTLNRGALTPLAKPQEGVAGYLEPSRFANSESPTIRRIAQGLRGSDSFSTVKNIIAWCDRSISYKLEGFTDVDQIIARKTVACEGYSALFTSLARACGVPAREVWGVVVSKDGWMNGHGWSEFYLDGRGWVPVDATPASKSDYVGPDYIRLGEYRTADEFRLWRNMVDMNVGPSTTATTPKFKILTQ
jgi:transglutaminase-like putative cysteine protease